MGCLESKVAIVSGAARGLGQAFAQALAAEGANLCLFDLDPGIDDTSAAIARHGTNVLSLVADVSQRADCERVVASAAHRFGGVDILINNAGRWRQTLLAAPWEQALADFDAVMNVNFKGTMMMSRLCAAEMLKRGAGDIVNISTCSVLPARAPSSTPPGMDVYDASKWALNGLTDLGAQWLRKDNIRVNALALGPTDTAMMRSVFASQEPPAEPSAQWLKPEQIAQLLIALLKDGRSGENIGAWPGHPVALGARKRWDVKMRERADFTGQPTRVFGAPPWTDAPEPIAHLAVRKE
jgi:3-oxoacyl-[acyl-carrier protein] reductase